MHQHTRLVSGCVVHLRPGEGGWGASTEKVTRTIAGPLKCLFDQIFKFHFSGRNYKLIKYPVLKPFFNPINEKRCFFFSAVILLFARLTSLSLAMFWNFRMMKI